VRVTGSLDGKVVLITGTGSGMGRAGALRFAAAGATVAADFRWNLLCRFDDDSEDLEEFMAALYALQSLKLRTVRS